VIRIRKVRHFFTVKGRIIPIFHRLEIQTIHSGLVLIFGDSGIGKSTLLSLIAGMLIPKSGNVFFNHQRYSKEEMKRYLTYQKHIRYVQQSFYLEGEWTVNTYFKMFNVPTSELTKLGLENNLLFRKTKHLSGGEKVRVYLGIMLHSARAILLLDEPTHGLDEENKQKVIELLSQNKGLTIVASHDEEFMSYAHQIIHIEGPHEVKITNRERQSKANHQGKSNLMNDRILKRHLVSTIAQQFSLQPLLISVVILSQIVFFSLFTLFGLTRQYKQYLFNNPSAYDVGYITSIERQTIQDSPFDLVTYSPPSIPYLRQLFSDLDGVEITANFRNLLPGHLEINGEHFMIDLMNIPFFDHEFSTSITHHQPLESMHDFSWNFLLFDVDAQWEQSFHISMPLHVKHQTITLTTLEPSVIYFSFPQIRFLLQNLVLNHPMYTQVEQLLLAQEEFLMLGFADKHQFMNVKSRIEAMDHLLFIHDYSGRLDEQFLWIDAGLNLTGILMMMSGILNVFLFINYLVIRLFHIKELLNHLMMIGVQIYNILRWLNDRTMIQILVIISTIFALIVWVFKDLKIFNLLTEFQWLLWFFWGLILLLISMKTMTLFIPNQKRFPYAERPSAL
jgi:ABC-type lipoprotein export system ATPase subunit